MLIDLKGAEPVDRVFLKAAILTNCLHGVDIDHQAVEVTVLSLYLKMLEGGRARRTVPMLCEMILLV
jgi:hypothetical protein